MKSILKLSLAAALAVSALSAKESEVIKGLDVSANMAVTTNYIWRGYTQNANTPTFQSGIDLAFGDFYAGTWGSGAFNGQEVDVYAGYTTEVAGVGIDVGYLEYIYTNQTVGTWMESSTFGEGYLGLSYSVADIDLGVTDSYDFINGNNNIELSAGYSVLSVAYGIASGKTINNSYLSVSAAIPCVVTGGEWGLTYGMTSGTTGAFALSHSFSF